MLHRHAETSLPIPKVPLKSLLVLAKNFLTYTSVSIGSSSSPCIVHTHHGTMEKAKQNEDRHSAAIATDLRDYYHARCKTIHNPESYIPCPTCDIYTL